MGIHTPLVDNEGYPRADIDVFRARTLRRRFIEIQNDHKALMGRIERGLVELRAIEVSAAVLYAVGCV
jgi:26S proteasome non-ATPase regulatory subunit 9